MLKKCEVHKRDCKYSLEPAAFLVLPTVSSLRNESVITFYPRAFSNTNEMLYVCASSQ